MRFGMDIKDIEQTTILLTMKLNFFAKMLGLITFCASYAHSDYVGGPLSNYGGTYSGNITITDPSTSTASGVYRTAAGTTILQGNILVDMSHGKGIDNSAGSRSGSYIVVETQSANDSIIVKASGTATTDIGIRQASYEGSTTINANKDGSFQKLDVTSGSDGIYAVAGTLTVNADTVVHSGRDGVFTGGLSAPPLTTHGSITMTGSLDVTASRTGIRTLAGDIDLTGVTHIKVDAPVGLQVSATAQGGGRIYLGSHLEMTGTTTSAITASGSGAEISGTGRYTFSGAVTTASQSTVDLTFTNGSNFTGATKISSGGIINFVLNGGTRWEVTDNSATTMLNVDQGGVMVFDLLNVATKTFSCVNSPEVILDVNSILSLNCDPDVVQVGDEYTLFAGLGTVFDNETDGVLNAVLQSVDGKYTYTYDNPAAGVFRILGISPTIPEPATASLGLFGLAGLMLLRRKV